MWRIEVLDSSSLQPSKSIPLPPGTHDVGREIPGNSDKRLSRKQLQLTLPTDSRVAMLKVTGANPSILQSAAGACQDLTKSTPAVTVGPEDVIWLRRVDSSGIRTLKYPIRVVAPSSVSDFHFTRRNHQDGGEGGGACAFTYRQRLCLMASLGQANFEGSQSFRPKIRASVTR